jgi:hypothetical protein
VLRVNRGYAKLDVGAVGALATARGGELMMPDALRQYRTLLRRRPKFALILIAVAALGILCEVAAHADLVHSPSDGAFRHLAGAFGDAFIVAALLAILVDPVVQHQFASEWGRDLYWAIFSPNAPQEFRDGLQALAAPVAFISRCQYELTFTYPAGGAKGFFELDWRILLWAEILDRRGFRLADRVFVVPRHDGTPTSYRLWRFEAEECDPISHDEGDLKSMEAISVDKSGRTVLDQGKISDIEKVAFRKKYWSERHLMTSRWASDFLPLFQPRIVLRQIIIIKGAPVGELDFTVAQLGGSQVHFTEHTKANGELELRCELTDVSFPGQASLVTWKPKVSALPPASGPPPGH